MERPSHERRLAAEPHGESALTLACGVCGGTARPVLHVLRVREMAVSCRLCGAALVLPIALESPAPRAAAGCPKCGAPRGVEACPRCGLVYRNWSGHGGARSDRLDTERLWREVAGRFDDPTRHTAFVAHCLHSGELAYAASRYAEEERAQETERARIAQARRRQVQALCDALLRRPPRPEPSSGAARRLVTLLGMAAVVLLVLWMGAVVLGPGAAREAGGAPLTLRPASRAGVKISHQPGPGVPPGAAPRPPG
ncbi:MAG TPA: hypothetical protein VGQ83_22175 [Polyangia bacterium]